MTTTCTRCDQPSPNGYLCNDCGDKLHGWLAEAPELGRQLDIEITRQARRSKGPSAAVKGAVQPLPVNLHASAVKDHLKGALRTLQRAVAPDRPTGTTIDGMCAWLVRHETAVALRPDAGACVNHLEDAMKRARRCCDNPPEQRFIGTHPCGERLHAWRNPADQKGGREERWIQCPGCGGRVGVEEAITALEDRCRDQLLTLREIATLGQISRNTVESWAKRNRLQSRGTVDGVRTFRFGDALLLRDDMIERKQAG